MTYRKMFVPFAFCLFALGVGSIALFWPAKMQEYALKYRAKFYFWPNPFLGWMKTRSDLVYLRVMGAVFLVAGLFVLLVALTSWGDVRQRNCREHIKEEIHSGTSLASAEAALKECGFKMTVDPVKKILFGDNLVEGIVVTERTQVLINLDSGNRVPHSQCHHGAHRT